MTYIAHDDFEANLFDALAADLVKARKLVEGKIAKAASHAFPHIEVLTITPAIAQVILERNPPDENRKLSLATVEKYARDMAEGRWKGMNGQTIVISRDGYLNDGQHRLNAVISSQGNIPFAVVFGADRESRLTLDQNKVRSSGDYMAMTGVPYANNVAAVAAMLHAYENGLLNSGKEARAVTSANKPTKAALHEYAQTRLEQIIRACRQVDMKESRVISSHTRIAAALCIIEDKAGFKDACDFIMKVIEGAELARSNPAFAARNRLIAEKQAGTATPHKTFEIIIRAWNSYRQGLRMSRLTLQGKIPAVEG